MRPGLYRCTFCRHRIRAGAPRVKVRDFDAAPAITFRMLAVFHRSCWSEVSAAIRKALAVEAAG